MRPLIGLTLVSMIVMSAVSDSAHATDQPVSGQWLGRSYADQNEQFAGCVIASRQGNQLYLLFKLTGNYDWYLGIGDGSWHLTSHEAAEVSVDVDGSVLYSNVAVPVSEQVVSMPLPSTRIVMDRLQQGHVLTLNLWDADVSFKLVDVEDALHALGDCVGVGLGTVQPHEQH